MLMKTMRTDVKRDKQQTRCLNSSTLGYSTWKLRCGDLFVYIEHYQDGSTGTRLAKYHGRIKPTDAQEWFILAQAASDNMQFTYERWIDPKNVLETVPKARTNEHIARFFEEKEKMWDKDLHPKTLGE